MHFSRGVFGKLLKLGKQMQYFEYIYIYVYCYVHRDESIVLSSENLARHIELIPSLKDREFIT